MTEMAATMGNDPDGIILRGVGGARHKRQLAPAVILYPRGNNI
jgi:hypothetical protein